MNGYAQCLADMIGPMAGALLFAWSETLSE